MPQSKTPSIPLSSIIFSQNYFCDDTDSGRIRTGFHYDNEQIHKDSKNIYNRLRSIYEDSKFVSEISNMFPCLPVIANERCGTWYIDPQRLCAESVYFKSTDGHTGNWAFNIRRLNAHLLDIIVKHSGCIVVDSTRRGKRLPDALSKTIPIWCCTINLAIKKYRDSIGFERKNELESFLLQEKSSEWDTEFHSLSSVISNSEHSQIVSLIPKFAQDLINSGYNIESLSNKLKKPLRPLWFTPSSNVFIHDLPDYSTVSFFPVICLSASQMVEMGSERRHGYLYVQGSADDHEMWAMGLTPSLFWKHHKTILNTNDPVECEKRVKEIVDGHRNTNPELLVSNIDASKNFDFIGNTCVAIGNYKSANPLTCWTIFDYIINCTPEPYSDSEPIPSPPYSNNYLQLSIPEGKKGQNNLFSSIPVALEFVKKPLEEKKRILIHCKQGIDRSVGIGLAVLVKYFDDGGVFIKGGVDNK
ncbi:15846_t:CDS:2, partial [Acaulospora morrowiae]